MNTVDSSPAYSALSVKNLRFRYHNGPWILSNFSEHFRRGRVTGITGESGRGKSTLLYILGLLLEPVDGVIRIGDVEVSKLTDRDRSYLRATHFGFVFQDAALDGSRTVLDNVCETALYRGEKVKDIENRAHELLDRFGVGLRATARPNQVSGGQAQRIALARALVHRPPILLCDEPTGNLDDNSSNIVLEALRQHAHEGGAVIIVTHSANVVEQCDREVRL